MSRRWMLPIVAVLAMSWAMPTAVTHAQVTLGSAASFGILVDGGSLTVGNSAVMGGFIGADDGNVSLGNNSTAPIVLADSDGNGTVMSNCQMLWIGLA